MKKRRELDALIGNRNKRDAGATDNGRIEYDSLSSLSSPTADTYMAPSGNYFNVSSKRVSRTSNRACGCTVRRMIRICLPACFLSLVAACITACIGIVWMQVQLKTDVEKLRDRIAILETWQSDQPSALDDMKKTMSNMQQDMLSVKNGENGINGLAERLAVLKQKFDEQVVVPNESLDEVRSQTRDIRKMIDDLKSSIQSMEETVKGMKTSQGSLTSSYDQLHDTVESIKKDVSDLNVKELTSLVTSSKQNTESDLKNMNSTLQGIAKNLTALQQTVTEIEQHIEPDEIWKALNPKISVIQNDVTSLKEAKASGDETVKSITNELKNLQSHISNLMSNVKYDTKVKDSIDSKKASPTVQTQLASKIPKLPDVSQGALSIVEILKGLLKRFDEIDKDKNGKLTNAELATTYTQDVANALLRYDVDRDGALSKTEISSSSMASPTSKRKQKRRSNR